MKVIMCDLEDTGTRWVFFGNKVLVNEGYLEDFTNEHPELSDSIAARRNIESYMSKLPEVV